jgi:hypothetical protein
VAKTKTRKNESAANVGYEAQLWQMADALRGRVRWQCYAPQSSNVNVAKVWRGANYVAVCASLGEQISNGRRAA